MDPTMQLDSPLEVTISTLTILFSRLKLLLGTNNAVGITLATVVEHLQDRTSQWE